MIYPHIATSQEQSEVATAQGGLGEAKGQFKDGLLYNEPMPQVSDSPGPCDECGNVDLLGNGLCNNCWGKLCATIANKQHSSVGRKAYQRLTGLPAPVSRRVRRKDRPLQEAA